MEASEAFYNFLWRGCTYVIKIVINILIAFENTIRMSADSLIVSADILILFSVTTNYNFYGGVYHDKEVTPACYSDYFFLSPTYSFISSLFIQAKSHKLLLII